MKKFATFLFVLILILSLAGCSNDPTPASTPVGCAHNWQRIEDLNEFTAVEQCTLCSTTRMYTDSENVSHSGTETGFVFLRYNWGGYGISHKQISSCDLGYAIVDCLSKLQETGAVISQISEDVIDEYTISLPVENGTVWIDCGSLGLFRLNPEMTEICKVETHLGEGKVLQMTDTLEELLLQAWYYYPYDYWAGTYENGSVSLRQLYKMDSAVDWAFIEDIHIENKIDSQNNSITLRLRGSEAKTVTVRLLSQQSDDNLGSEDVQEVTLVPGHEASTTLSFDGFYNVSYTVTITIDNTKIVLLVNP